MVRLISRIYSNYHDTALVHCRQKWRGLAHADSNNFSVQI